MFLANKSLRNPCVSAGARGKLGRDICAARGGWRRGASAVRDECPQCGSCAVCGSGGRRCVRTLGRPVRGAGLRRPKN